MYDNYEDEYEHDTETHNDNSGLIWLIVIFGGALLVAFTLGAIAGSVFG